MNCSDRYAHASSTQRQYEGDSFQEYRPRNACPPFAPWSGLSFPGASKASSRHTGYRSSGQKEDSVCTRVLLARTHLPARQALGIKCRLLAKKNSWKQSARRSDEANSSARWLESDHSLVVPDKRLSDVGKAPIYIHERI